MTGEEFTFEIPIDLKYQKRSAAVDPCGNVLNTAKISLA